MGSLSALPEKEEVHAREKGYESATETQLVVATVMELKLSWPRLLWQHWS
jgi:hypothetical protein